MTIFPFQLQRRYKQFVSNYNELVEKHMSELLNMQDNMQYEREGMKTLTRCRDIVKLGLKLGF